MALLHNTSCQQKVRRRLSRHARPVHVRVRCGLGSIAGLGGSLPPPSHRPSSFHPNPPATFRNLPRSFYMIRSRFDYDSCLATLDGTEPAGSQPATSVPGCPLHLDPCDSSVAAQRWLLDAQDGLPGASRPCRA
jgi:hypothetical protein